MTRLFSKYLHRSFGHPWSTELYMDSEESMFTLADDESGPVTIITDESGLASFSSLFSYLLSHTPRVKVTCILLQSPHESEEIREFIEELNLFAQDNQYFSLNIQEMLDTNQIRFPSHTYMLAGKTHKLLHAYQTLCEAGVTASRIKIETIDEL